MVIEFGIAIYRNANIPNIQFWPGFGYSHGQSALAQIWFWPKHYAETAKTVKLGPDF